MKFKQVSDGIGEYRFDNFGGFIDFIYGNTLELPSYVWRGHRQSTWRLESTLLRLRREASVDKVKGWEFQDEHLESFKMAARGRRGINPPSIADENEWWALGQHHGLATPLLDWTTSAFVATFFAFADSGPDQTPDRAIYALHRPTVEYIAKSLDMTDNELIGYAEGPEPTTSAPQISHPEVTFIRPQQDENIRLLAQGGLFTRGPGYLTLEDWIERHSCVHRFDLTLIKFLIPNEERPRCLRMLNRMNINPLTLFPDLGGASRYCNLYSEIEDY